MAWRNTWRNTTRSLVVIIAVILGIWAAMFMTGFATGMSRSYINNAIQNALSHLQIHEPDFLRDRSVKHLIPNLEEVHRIIVQQPGVHSVSRRTVVNAMISSGQATRGITIKGVDPIAEAALSDLSEKVIEGSYFEEGRKNQILISRKLSEKLKVRIRSKLVLTFQDLSGTITAGAFRISGIFESGNTPFDEANVFVRQTDLNLLLIPAGQAATVIDDPTNIAHEIAIMLEQPGRIEAVEEVLQAALPGLQVDTYREIAPDLQLYESQIQNISLIYLAVIMLALIFGIVNTMLMAVLDRIRELGMLMAIGMNKLRVFLMIVMETILLCLIGAPVGLLLGFLTVRYLGSYGIDLSAFSNSLQMYGLSERVYFELEPVVYYQVPLTVMLTALLAALYPAFKAIRLRPVEAIRKI